MQIPSAIVTLVIGMILVLTGLWIGQSFNLLPVDASANAPIYDELFQVLFTIGAILFIGIVGLLVFSLIRFRRRPGQLGDGIAMEGNLPLEIFWTAVPAIVVLFVGLYSYDIYDRMGGMVPLAHDHMATSGAAAGEERIWGGISSGSIEDAATAPAAGAGRHRPHTRSRPGAASSCTRRKLKHTPPACWGSSRQLFAASLVLKG